MGRGVSIGAESEREREALLRMEKVVVNEEEQRRRHAKSIVVKSTCISSPRSSTSSCPDAICRALGKRLKGLSMLGIGRR